MTEAGRVERRRAARPPRRARGTRVARLVPEPLRDPAQRPALLGWLGVGLLARFVLMPFTVSADLLAVYWRAQVIAYDGEVFGSYLVNMGAHYVHAVSLRLTDWMMPTESAIWTDPWWWAQSGALSGQVQRAFAEAPWAPQTLFALKLPYLGADLVAGLLLLALVARCGAGPARRAWALWMLSPIGLYAGYAFGRYEMLAVVLVVAALWAVEREHPWWGAVLLGLAVTMRGYPLLLIPVFGLLAVRGLPRQVAWAALALAPFAGIMVTNRLLAGTVGELARLQDFTTGSTFLAYTLPVDGTGQLYVFVAFLLALYGVLAGRVWGWWPASSRASEISASPPPSAVPEEGTTVTRSVDAGELWVWLLVLHAGMFALATFSAHYFAWFVPFVCLAVARRTSWRGTLPLHLLQAAVVLAIADALGGPGTLLGLFQPLEPDLATSLPNLREALIGSGQAAQLVGLLRTAFVVLTVLLVAPALRELARAPAPPAAPVARHASR